ncbi:2'-5' RNA ligase family protein [Streptomyces sp. NPDC058284]|uniref:2'-5' RNA ligase family protein n=1 Tax=unclassified Streptomyces TaxID=2593676 RepID=UPI003654E9F4
MTAPLVPDSRAFPPAPPLDMNDIGSVLAADWEAFRGIERMTDHWARPGWGAKNRTLYWMLTFPTATSLIEEALFCQEHLASHQLDPVPEDGLHLTMNRIGSPHDITPRGVDELARQAARLAGAPFAIQAHPMAGSPGAVRFSVTPWSPLVELHAALGEAVHTAAIPSQGRPTSLFRPHLGILYCPKEQPAAPLIRSVAALRKRHPISLRVESVELVELRRAARTYRWDVLHSVPLQGVA